MKEHLVVLFRLRTRLLQSEQFIEMEVAGVGNIHGLAPFSRSPLASARAALARGERLNEIGSSFIADAQYEIPLRSALKGRGDDAIDAVLGRLVNDAGIGKAAAVVVLGQLLALAVFETQVRVQREGAVHFDGVGFVFEHLDQENFGVMALAHRIARILGVELAFIFEATGWHVMGLAGFMSLDLEQFEGMIFKMYSPVPP